MSSLSQSLRQALRQYIAPLFVVIVFLIALLATSARIFLPSDLAAPAPVGVLAPHFIVATVVDPELAERSAIAPSSIATAIAPETKPATPNGRNAPSSLTDSDWDLIEEETAFSPPPAKTVASGGLPPALSVLVNGAAPEFDPSAKL